MSEKRRRYAVTALHIGKRFYRTGCWELKYDATKDEAEDEIRIVQSQNVNWPPGTIWKVRRL